MKRILFIVSVVLLSCISINAQISVTKFLGIPVDGDKYEMIQKLKAKGFRSSNTLGSNTLEGEFNGKDVYVSVVTNNNKVYRIAVADKNKVNESDIKIRFNTLCNQFKNNPKYIPYTDDQSLSEDEDISYNMTVNNKRYQASFLQKSSDEIIDYLTKGLNEKFTKEEMANLSEEQIKEYSKEYANKYLDDVASKRHVWFMISSISYDQYYIYVL